MIPSPATIAALYPYAVAAYETGEIEGSEYLKVGATEVRVWFAVDLLGEIVCIISVAGSVSLLDWGANIFASTTGQGYHRGYSIGVNAIMAILTNWIAARVPAHVPIYVAGHSRGGGQGDEIAARLHSGHDIAGVVTWGAPGVYTRAAVARHPLSDRTANVINRWDPVPHLAIHLHRPGTDIPGPSWGHRIHRYAPHPTQEYTP